MSLLLALGLPCGLAGKESTCNEGDLSSTLGWEDLLEKGKATHPRLGRSPGEGKGYPLQYPSLENSMDCIVHGVIKSWTQLSDFHFHFTFSISLSELPGKLKAMVFSVVMHRCESWTIKKAERQRIGAFELRCWRGLLRVSWTARRS